MTDTVVEVLTGEVRRLKAECERLRVDAEQHKKVKDAIFDEYRKMKDYAEHMSVYVREASKTMLEARGLSEWREIKVLREELQAVFKPDEEENPPWRGSAPCYYCDFAYSKNLKNQHVNPCEWCIHNHKSLLYQKTGKPAETPMGSPRSLVYQKLGSMTGAALIEDENGMLIWRFRTGDWGKVFETLDYPFSRYNSLDEFISDMKKLYEKE